MYHLANLKSKVLINEILPETLFKQTKKKSYTKSKS